MVYHLGQTCGIAAMILCFVMPLFKKKWQMLLITGLVNLFFALNLLFIDQVGTGIIMNAVAIVQTLVSYRHLKNGTPVTKTENLLFFVLYVGLGSLGFHSMLDLLPIIAAVFNMLATFQPDEQKTRFLTMINAGIYFAYYAALGASAMLAELLGMITSIIGMVRYRKKK